MNAAAEIILGAVLLGTAVVGVWASYSTRSLLHSKRYFERRNGKRLSVRPPSP